VSRGRNGKTPVGDRQAAKQERAAQRAARQEESVRRRKRAVLRQRLTKAAIITLVVGGLAAWILVPRRGSYTAGGTGELVEGVQFFQNPTGHTTGPVTYPQTPPAGGAHHPTWLNCGIYGEPVPNVYAVHSLEHGAVWVTYDPELSADALAALREHLPSSYVILSPYVGLPAPIVLSAWNVQLRVDSPDDPRLPRFFEEYWRNQNVPEPGALCTGGSDGPGRIS
jgi:hypothetical protein